MRDLTESSKSLTSNAKSIKWRVGTYLYQMGYKPHGYYTTCRMTTVIEVDKIKVFQLL